MKPTKFIAAFLAGSLAFAAPAMAQGVEEDEDDDLLIVTDGGGLGVGADVLGFVAAIGIVVGMSCSGGDDDDGGTTPSTSE